MIWAILALFGAGSFIFSGFSVLTDSTCRSVDFGGGRVVQMTCRTDDLGAFSNIAAGSLSILGGLLLLAILFRKPLTELLDSFWNPKPISSDSAFYDSTKAFPTEFKKESEKINLGSTTDAEAIIDDEQKKCPKCAELIKREAIKCRHCGSSLLPSVEDKLKQKFSQTRNKAWLGVGLVGALVLGGFTVNSINLGKERQLLNSNGQVCAFLADEEVNLGCADYPNVEFSFCSTSASMELDYADSNYESIFEYEGTQPTRFNGSQYGSCSAEYPYSYKISTVTNKLIGNYDVQSWTYTVPANETADFSSGDDFRIEVSLK